MIWCNYGEDVAEALARFGIVPDAGIESADQPDDKVLFFHRQSDGCDIYFVYNHSASEYNKPVSLRTSRLHAELWSPKNVTRDKAELSQDNTLPLHLDPWEAKFIVVY